MDAGLDLSVVPLSYPGPMIARSGVLHVGAGRFVAGQVPGTGGRTPVLAVGSNASAGVLLWKLRQGGVGGEVPMARVTVRNLVVAASAHVGRPGFVPAAPAHREGGRSELVIGWFDRDQLDCVDRTEPNYRRVRLSSASYPIQTGFPPGFFEVYESSWGVLAEAGEPVRLAGQAELASWLGSRGLVPWSESRPPEAVARLADSIDLRERARAAFRSAGLAAGSGLRVSRPPGR